MIPKFARIAFLVAPTLLVGACMQDDALADGSTADAVRTASSATQAEAQVSPLLDRTVRIASAEGFSVEGPGVSQLHSLSPSRKQGSLAKFDGFGYQELAQVRLAPGTSPSQVLQGVARQMGESLGVDFGRAVDTNHPHMLLLNHPDGVLTLALLPVEEAGLHSVRATYAVHARP